MIRGTVPAKAVAVPKPAVQEPPVKFRSGKHTVIVKEVFDIAPKYPQTYLIRFTFENEPVFDFEPGQFISIFAEKDGKRISRPYSIASWPENKDYLELCIKIVEGGFMSNYLYHVSPGTKLQSIGPLGRFVIPEPIQYDTVFVATGTGVAPFIAMMGHIWAQGLDRGHEFHVVFGVRYVHDLIYRSRIQTFPMISRWSMGPNERLSRLRFELSPTTRISPASEASETRFTRNRSGVSGSRTTTRSPFAGGRNLYAHRFTRT